MKKTALTAIAAASLCCLTAQAARVGIPLSVTANGTNEAAGVVENVAISPTNFVNVVGFIVTQPALTDCTLQFGTHVGGVIAPLNDMFSLVNRSSNAVVRCFIPARQPSNVRNQGAEAFPLYGTNTVYSIRQNTATTNTYSFILLIEQ